MKVGDPKLDALVKRPVKHLSHFTALHPQVWQDHDYLRNEYMKFLKPTKWPQWCYAPVEVAGHQLDVEHTPAEVIALLQQERRPRSRAAYISDLLERENGADKIATLAAWRVTKGIYVFDEAVFDALWETPLDGDLPVELLQRLPEWCVYVAFPKPLMTKWGPHITGNHMAYGFFATLVWDVDGAVRLILMVDADNPDNEPPLALYHICLKLTGNLSECCAAFRNIAEFSTENFQSCIEDDDPEFRDHPMWHETISSFRSGVTKWSHEQEVELIRPMVAILLYLCSAEPDIQMDPLRGLRNRTVKTKKGIRHFGPDQPPVHKVGYVIGPAVRLAKEEVARYSKLGDRVHASPRAHIRKAHFQTYWIGPRASISKEQPTQRRLILKFKALTLVCAESGESIIPTIHPVLPPEMNRTDPPPAPPSESSAPPPCG